MFDLYVECRIRNRFTRSCSRFRSTLGFRLSDATVDNGLGLTRHCRSYARAGSYWLLNGTRYRNALTWLRQWLARWPAAVLAMVTISQDAQTYHRNQDSEP